MFVTVVEGNNKFVVPVEDKDFKLKSFGTGFMMQQIRTACPTCAGRGYTLIHKCYGCDGRGTKSAAHDLRIILPKGIDSGQYLKIENAGDFKNGE